ncbi:hypothetical protein ACQPYK_12215 [Streptosporangium sp. CA-135522]|uniref:hypothetical protein n=1 Tax=Streptosporangium sp. CA-135522 TaxID=3240072 RepID=UPI003D8E5921
MEPAIQITPITPTGQITWDGRGAEPPFGSTTLEPAVQIAPTRLTTRDGRTAGTNSAARNGRTTRLREATVPGRTTRGFGAVVMGVVRISRAVGPGRTIGWEGTVGVGGLGSLDGSQRKWRESHGIGKVERRQHPQP